MYPLNEAYISGHRVGQSQRPLLNEALRVFLGHMYNPLLSGSGDQEAFFVTAAFGIHAIDFGLCCL